MGDVQVTPDEKVYYQKIAKVYVVTEGEYSSYHIVGVFSSQEKAEKFLEFQRHSDYDEWEIEEYEIDIFEPQVKKGLRFYHVVMDQDGNSRVELQNWPEHDSEYQGERNWLMDERDRPLETFGRRNTGRALLRVYTFAKDEQHAVKIANEKRAQKIVSNEWTYSDGDIGKHWPGGEVT